VFNLLGFSLSCLSFWFGGSLGFCHIYSFVVLAAYLSLPLIN
jgi:hypothetical protein